MQISIIEHVYFLNYSNNISLFVFFFYFEKLIINFLLSYKAYHTHRLQLKNIWKLFRYLQK